MKQVHYVQIKINLHPEVEKQMITDVTEKLAFQTFFVHDL